MIVFVHICFTKIVTLLLKCKTPPIGSSCSLNSARKYLEYPGKIVVGNIATISSRVVENYFLRATALVWRFLSVTQARYSKCQILWGRLDVTQRTLSEPKILFPKISQRDAGTNDIVISKKNFFKGAGLLVSSISLAENARRVKFFSSIT
jgi:hypothetical protein